MSESIVLDTTWIESQVDRLLDRTGKSSGRHDGGWFHPSDLSNPCDAAVAFSYLGYPRGSGVDARVQRIFDMGNARDKAWKSYLDKAGLSVSSLTHPLRFTMHDWRIRGECDAILRNIASDELWIGEIKTINQNGFDRLDDQPLPEHLIQVHCYMKGHDIPRAVVIYENKNDCRVKMIPVAWQEDVWEGIQRRIVTIIEALREGYYFDRTCKYGCDYKTICPMYNPADGKQRLKVWLK